MNKKILIAGLSLLGVIILAGAAFLAARLLNNNGQGLVGPGLSLFAGGNGGMTKSVQMNIKSAPEVPQRKADLVGQITLLKDNGFMLANAKMMPGMGLSLSVDKGGPSTSSEPQLSAPESSAADTEVVITPETVIYIDATFANRDIGDMPEEGEEIQQIVEAAKGEDITKDSFVSVWGNKRGDRMIAETILLSKPVIYRMKK